ncbi:MAG: hypothetical protein RL716_737 [Actinomycetota bacterium]|jgi:ABC-type multidrug transport system permease subunit
MDESAYLALFTVISFTMLSLGSLVLALITRQAEGNRSFAIILALFSMILGGYVAVSIDQRGVIAALVGAVALIISLRRSRRQ